MTPNESLISPPCVRVPMPQQATPEEARIETLELKGTQGDTLTAEPMFPSMTGHFYLRIDDPRLGQMATIYLKAPQVAQLVALMAQYLAREVA